MNKAEARDYLEKFIEGFPRDFLRRVDNRTVGIGLLVAYLYESNQALSAGEIAKYMNVSSARVAVLLKTMESKDLIIRESDPNDARKTIVRISDNGRRVAERKENDLLETVRTVAEKVGEENFIRYIETGKDIKNAFLQIMKDNPEPDDVLSNLLL